MWESANNHLPRKPNPKANNRSSAVYTALLCITEDAGGAKGRGSFRSVYSGEGKSKTKQGIWQPPLLHFSRKRAEWGDQDHRNFVDSKRKMQRGAQEGEIRMNCKPRWKAIDRLLNQWKGEGAGGRTQPYTEEGSDWGCEAAVQRIDLSTPPIFLSLCVHGRSYTCTGNRW